MKAALFCAIAMALTACSNTQSTSASSAAPGDQPSSQAAKKAPAGNVCDRNIITQGDVQPLFSEPITSVGPLPGDPQSCLFHAGNSSVTISVRPNLGDVTVKAMLEGKMNVDAKPVSGVGDKAAWVDILKEINASKNNLLCDVGAIGPATRPANQQAEGALCTKIFNAY